jgi:hypothetical protein
MSFPDYKKVESTVLDESEDHYLFQLMFEHMAELIGPAVYEKSPNSTRKFPTEAETLLNLWWLSCEVNGNGFESYLLQRSAVELRAGYEALKVVGAHELVGFFEAGIELAGTSADFASDQEADWLWSIGRPSKYKELQELDVAAAPFISERLSSLAANYIRANRHVL